MMTDQLTIFISSTFLDLQEYREIARNAIFGLREHANDMIFWSADERNPSDLSLEELHEADLVLLIVAYRYGTIPNNSDKSITELEFDYAQELGIPILPFFVDENYGWPPSKIDIRQYEKLLAFKDKIREYCTPTFFTTPESLATVVTQAIANFDRRKRPWLNTPSIIAPPERVFHAKALKSRVDLLVDIGKAEDGIPLALKITRSDDLAVSLENVTEAINLLENTGLEIDLASRDDYVKRLIFDTKKRWLTRGISTPDNSAIEGSSNIACYVSKSTAVELFSTTLLGRLLQPLSVDNLQQGKADKIATVIDDFTQPIDSFGGNNRFLALPIDSTSPKYIVGKLPNSSRYKGWRHYFEESLLGFSEVKFTIFVDNEILTSDRIENYFSFVNQLFKDNTDESQSTRFAANFSVSRMAVAQTILQIVRNLNEHYHRNGIVHGDIKPNNVLVTKDKTVLIDGLNMEVGGLSSALTPAWAAPEQIAGLPISSTTDLYPIGLMLASVLGGKLGGEVVRFQVPSDPAGPVIVSFLRNPMVYLDHSQVNLERHHRKEWLAFIEKCLRFDPAERFQDPEQCAVELEQLLKRFQIPGYIEMQLNRSVLRLAQMPKGNIELCRIIKDNPYSEIVPATLLNQSSPPPPRSDTESWLDDLE